MRIASRTTVGVLIGWADKPNPPRTSTKPTNSILTATIPWPWSACTISNFEIVHADHGQGIVAVRIELVGFVEVRGGFGLSAQPIKTPTVVREAIRIPRIKLAAPVEPFHGASRDVFIIQSFQVLVLIAHSTFFALDAVRFADSIGGIRILWLNGEGFGEQGGLFRRVG